MYYLSLLLNYGKFWFPSCYLRRHNCFRILTQNDKNLLNQTSGFDMTVKGLSRCITSSGAVLSTNFLIGILHTNLGKIDTKDSSVLSS